MQKIEDIAAFLAETAKLVVSGSDRHRQLTPDEVAARLVDVAGILRALAKGTL